MARAVVIDADAANRLTLGAALRDDWLDTFEPPPGIDRVTTNGVVYLIGLGAKPDSRLLVMDAGPHQLLGAAKDESCSSS
jgi:hypothetical protein